MGTIYVTKDAFPFTDSPGQAGSWIKAADVDEALIRRVSRALDEWGDSSELAGDFAARLVEEARVHFVANRHR